MLSIADSVLSITERRICISCAGDHRVFEQDLQYGSIDCFYFMIPEILIEP